MLVFLSWLPCIKWMLGLYVASPFPTAGGSPGVDRVLGHGSDRRARHRAAGTPMGPT